MVVARDQQALASGSAAVRKVCAFVVRMYLNLVGLMLLRCYVSSVWVQVLFLRHDGYLGAVGALVAPGRDGPQVN